MEQIKINYDGKWPNLCSGHLEVWIGNKYYDFGDYCMISGGCVMRDEDWNMWTEEGLWVINEDSIPNDFPKDRLQNLLDEINNTIPHGCCGGCI